MANIATFQLATFLKPSVPRGRVTAHGLMRLATRSFGRSYYVPTWHFDDYPRRVIYTQHGEKWSPTGVERVWERYAGHLDAAWVRWFDSGGDHDVIFRFSGAFGDGRLCRYGFDSVRIHVPESPGVGWRPVQAGVWETDLSGTYFAGNDRCDLIYEAPRVPSCTTPVRGWRLGLVWKLNAIDEFTAEANALEPLVNAGASGVEFCWRGRAVRVAQKRGERWWQWNLDDWDNCRDPVWLAYCAGRSDLVS